MADNIEIKAHVRDIQALHRRAESLSGGTCQVIQQEDTFFLVLHGRLKLRQLSAEHGQLIYYLREDKQGPKRSEYHIYETKDPKALKEILVRAYGVRGVVRKVRCLYMVGQTRIHLDEVEGLGQFLELEVVLKPGQSNAQGQQIAQDLMNRLGVTPDDLIDVAYIDLLENANNQAACSTK